MPDSRGEMQATHVSVRIDLLTLADALAAAVEEEERAIVDVQDEGSQRSHARLATARAAKNQAVRAFLAARRG